MGAELCALRGVDMSYAGLPVEKVRYLEAHGTGTQANASGKEWPLKWTQGADDLLTVDGWSDDKKATLYFRFPKSREGHFGSSTDKLDKQLTVK